MYKCECGKEFETPASFNGHKCHCEVHLKSKGTYENYLIRNINTCAKIRELRIEKQKLRKQADLTQWLLEKHICEHCGKIMTEKFATGRFCSRSCAASRERNDEVRAKVSKALKGRPGHPNANNVFKKGHKGIGNRKAATLKALATRKTKKLNRSYEQLTLREQILFDQDGKCKVCHLDTWQDKPIKIEFHHIDGNHKNNVKENIEALCPNCHSQTVNWRKKKCSR